MNELFRDECKSQGVGRIGEKQDGRFDEQVLHELEDRFDAMKYTMDLEAKTIRSSDGSCKVLLDAGEFKKMWDEAHRQPLALFRKKVKTLVNMNKTDHLIVVSDGSSYHAFMQKDIKAICSRLKVPTGNLVLTHDVDNKAK